MVRAAGTRKSQSARQPGPPLPGNGLARARIRRRPDSRREFALRRRAGVASLRDPAGRGAQRWRQFTLASPLDAGSDRPANRVLFRRPVRRRTVRFYLRPFALPAQWFFIRTDRSEEHTSE